MPTDRPESRKLRTEKGATNTLPTISTDLLEPIPATPITNQHLASRTPVEIHWQCMMTILTPSSSVTIFPIQVLTIMIDLQTCSHLVNHALPEGADIHSSCVCSLAVASPPFRITNLAVRGHSRLICWCRLGSEQRNARRRMELEPGKIRRRTPAMKKRVEVLAPTELRVDSLLCDSK